MIIIKTHIFLLSTGLVLLLPVSQNKIRMAKEQKGEPCDWFIDLLQKRRLSREAGVPPILLDVTEEPKEYMNFNYTDPLDFSADNVKVGKNSGCSLTTTTTSTTTEATTTTNTPCDIPSTTTTPEPCQEKREIPQNIPTFRKRRRKFPKPVRTKRYNRENAEDYDDYLTLERDCFETKPSPKEKTLLEANIHVGVGFQELLLDMLSPGDKSIKISEEDDTQIPHQMTWEVINHED